MPIGPPKTVAGAGKDSMMSGGGTSPLPTKPDQAGGAGVKCGSCGHYHKPGSICSFKSMDDLDFLIKGNPYHEPKGKPNGGQFAKKPDNTTTGDDGIVAPTKSPVIHSGGQGPGDGKDDGKPDDPSNISTSEGNMSKEEFANAKEEKPKAAPWTGPSYPKPSGSFSDQDPDAIADDVLGGPVGDQPDTPKAPTDTAVDTKDKFSRYGEAYDQATSQGASQREAHKQATAATGGAIPHRNRKRFEESRQGAKAPADTLVDGPKAPADTLVDGPKAPADTLVDGPKAPADTEVDALAATQFGGEAPTDTVVGSGRGGPQAAIRSDIQAENDAKNAQSLKEFQQIKEAVKDQPRQSGIAPLSPIEQKEKQQRDALQGLMGPGPSDSRHDVSSIAQTASATAASRPQAQAATQAWEPSAQPQDKPSTEQYDRLVKEEKYGKTYDRAVKQGFSPQDAHMAASQATGGHTQQEGWQSPNERRAAEKEKAEKLKQDKANAKKLVAGARQSVGAQEKQQKLADQASANKEKVRAKPSNQAVFQDLDAANNLGADGSVSGPQPSDDLSSMIGPSGQSAMAQEREAQAATEDLRGMGAQVSPAPSNKQDAKRFKEADAALGKQPAAAPKQPKQQQQAAGAAARRGKAPPTKGLPFSQMYGAGAGIGSSMTQEAGGVGPTAAFAAQRAHQLLNPDLRPHTAPAMAGTGTGARTKDRHPSGTLSAQAPGMGKSVETLLGMM